MKPVYSTFLFTFLCFCQPCTTQSPAQTPPMGWNSYHCFGSAVHEDAVMANADYLAHNLKPFGWQSIVVDFLWSYDNPPGSKIGNPFQKNLPDGSYVAWMTSQQGENPRELCNQNGSMVWYSQVPGSKDLCVGLFNLSENSSAVQMSFAALGLKGKVRVRNLWQKQNLGLFKQFYRRQINKHGAALLRLIVV